MVLRVKQDDTAAAAAALAQRAAGVAVVELHTAGQMHQAVAVLNTVWHSDPSASVIESNTLMALAHAGNYVSAALLDEQMVGVCVGFFHRPPTGRLHSHIAGVLPQNAGKGVGQALKAHQRAWALDAGLDTITWTFDPLVARNAYLNLNRLGASVDEYLIDFYGVMADGINDGQQTDRMLVSWNLFGRPDRKHRPDPDDGEPAGPSLLAPGPDGGPVGGGFPPEQAGRCRVQIPTDIETLRVQEPRTARAWRTALREVLQPLLTTGWQIVGFDRSGAYRLARRPQRPDAK